MNIGKTYVTVKQCMKCKTLLSRDTVAACIIFRENIRHVNFHLLFNNKSRSNVALIMKTLEKYVEFFSQSKNFPTTLHSQKNLSQIGFSVDFKN